jgi:hypothetical protein
MDPKRQLLQRLKHVTKSGNASLNMAILAISFCGEGTVMERPEIIRELLSKDDLVEENDRLADSPTLLRAVKSATPDATSRMDQLWNSARLEIVKIILEYRSDLKDAEFFIETLNRENVELAETAFSSARNQIDSSVVEEIIKLNLEKVWALESVEYPI